MSLPSSTYTLIVGAGPTGLAAALSLIHRGFRDFVIVDAVTQGENSSRAVLIHAATMEVSTPMTVNYLFISPDILWLHAGVGHHRLWRRTCLQRFQVAMYDTSHSYRHDRSDSICTLKAIHEASLWPYYTSGPYRANPRTEARQLWSHRTSSLQGHRYEAELK